MAASCATRSPQLADVAPPKAPSYVCAGPPPEPTIPDDAGILQPVTDVEKAAVTIFLQAMHRHVDWGRALAERADKSARWCAGQAK